MKLALKIVASSMLLLSLVGCSSPKEIATPAAPSTAVPPANVDPHLTRKDLPDAKLSLDGEELRGWQITQFGGHGEVSAKDGEIRIERGAELSGFNWTNANILPKTNYEIELDAMKLDGFDFFCGLTLPFSDSFFTLIVGGWGGGLVGISSINGADASENDSTRNLYFEKNRWFHIRVQVTPEKIIAWIDQDKVVDLLVDGRRISMRGGEIETSVPLGIATYQTSALIKNVRIKTL